MATGGTGQLLLVITGVLSARMLGPDGRGFFALWAIFPLLAISLVRCGFPAAVAFSLSHGASGFRVTRRLIGQTIAVQTAVGLILCFGLSEAYAGMSSWSAGVYIYWMAPTFTGILLSEYSYAVFQGFGKFDLLNLSRLTPLALVGAGYVALFVSSAGNIFHIILIWSVCLFASGICFFVLSIRLIHARSGRGSLMDTKAYLRYAVRGAIGSTNLFDAFRMDQLACGVLLPQSGVGIYAVGQSFSNFPKLIAQSAGYVAFPMVALRQSRSRELIAWTSTRIVPAILATVVVIWSAIPFVLPILFGSEFSGGIGIARILVVAAGLGAVRFLLLDLAKGLGWPAIGSVTEVILVAVFGTGLWLFAITDGRACAYLVLASQGIALTATMVLLRAAWVGREKQGTHGRG